MAGDSKHDRLANLFDKEQGKDRGPVIVEIGFVPPIITSN